MSSETILILVILGIAGLAALFFLLTFYLKLLRIKETRQKKEFQERIDSMLFSFLFKEQTIAEVLTQQSFSRDMETPLFQRLAIKSLVSLHHSYSGLYSRKLEDFYAASGLVQYSLKKLNARDWADVVEGIRDLSSLNYLQSYPRIVSLQNHPSPNVRTEVLLGMIKLKGISEVLKFRHKSLFLNDWVQSNILFTVKKYHIDAPEALHLLLQSKNRSILLLAVRLINYYKAAEHYEKLAEFYAGSKDEKLRSEIARILNRIEQIA